MKNDISNRHRGTLDGRFTDERLPAKITISMTREVAASRTAQHLTWMFVNLLARQTAEIQEINLNIPQGVSPIERLSPLIPETPDFISALREGIKQINPSVLTPHTQEHSHIGVRVGPGIEVEADFSLTTTANGWSGYVGQHPTDILGEDCNSIGAYAAASMCAAEIFKFVRGMRPDVGTFVDQLWFDVYRLQVSKDVPSTPALPSELQLPAAVVAGIGAVANGFLHTLYPLAQLSGELTLIDNDIEGITDTNLNRYVLFGLPHITTKHFKASTAAAMFGMSRIKAYGIDDSWQRWVTTRNNAPLSLVISAVDTNSARHAIQDALPRLILGASTKGMRAQMNLYDVFNGGQCLRCRNRVEEKIANDVVIETLRNLSPEARIAEALRVGVRLDALETFLADPHANCGMIAGATLQNFANATNGAEWSVGFVSLMAGLLLAAEYLKLGSGFLKKSLDSCQNTFRFQFWHPGNSKVNKITGTPPEETCLCQSRMFGQAISSLLY